MMFNDQVTEIPRRAVTRTVRLASLPLGLAGREGLIPEPEVELELEHHAVTSRHKRLA